MSWPEIQEKVWTSARVLPGTLNNYNNFSTALVLKPYLAEINVPSRTNGPSYFGTKRVYFWQLKSDGHEDRPLSYISLKFWIKAFCNHGRSLLLHISNFDGQNSVYFLSILKKRYFVKKVDDLKLVRFYWKQSVDRFESRGKRNHVVSGQPRRNNRAFFGV